MFHISRTFSISLEKLNKQCVPCYEQGIGLGKYTLQLYNDTIQDFWATIILDTDIGYSRKYCIRYDTFNLYLKKLRYIRIFLTIDLNREL